MQIYIETTIIYNTAELSQQSEKKFNLVLFKQIYAKLYRLPQTTAKKIAFP